MSEARCEANPPADAAPLCEAKPLPLGEIVHAVLAAAAKRPAAPTADDVADGVTLEHVARTYEDRAKRVTEMFAQHSVSLEITTTGRRAAERRIAMLTEAVAERGFADWIASLSLRGLVLRRPGKMWPVATIDVLTPLDVARNTPPWRKPELPYRDLIFWYDDVKITYA